MSTRQGYRALSFSVGTIKLASRFGLKAGAKKAAARLNPVTMVLDTTLSVLEAADSWLKLKNARVHRDGLAATIKKDALRLQAEREQLAGELEIAKKQLDLHMQSRKMIGELALRCARLVKDLLADMAQARREDLPDLDAIDQLSRKVEGAWDHMRLAMEQFQQISD